MSRRIEFTYLILAPPELATARRATELWTTWTTSGPLRRGSGAAAFVPGHITGLLLRHFKQLPYHGYVVKEVWFIELRELTSNSVGASHGAGNTAQVAYVCTGDRYTNDGILSLPVLAVGLSTSRFYGAAVKPLYEPVD